MKNTVQHNILYSCDYKSKMESEQLVPEHSLTYIQSGTLRFTGSEGTKEFESGSITLIRKNELVKTTKIPDKLGKPFRSVAIFLTQDLLRQYAAEHHIPHQPFYSDAALINLSQSELLKGYFQSLIPYLDQPAALSPKLAVLKTGEAIELLLQIGNLYQRFLFDFHEPHKIDLEAFMLKNYEFNVPIKEFARLSGRSLSTFKRDFIKLLFSTPEKWLKERRLQKAHYLIQQMHHKPSDVYLQVGFENFSHFSNAFKTHFGYNASEVYRPTH